MLIYIYKSAIIVLATVSQEVLINHLLSITNPNMNSYKNKNHNNSIQQQLPVSANLVPHRTHQLNWTAGVYWIWSTGGGEGEQ